MYARGNELLIPIMMVDFFLSLNTYFVEHGHFAYLSFRVFEFGYIIFLWPSLGPFT